MMTLIEPFTSINMMDRPNLGCATLAASLNENTEKITKIVPSYLIFDLFFTRCMPELYQLITKHNIPLEIVQAGKSRNYNFDSEKAFLEITNRLYQHREQLTLQKYLDGSFYELVFAFKTMFNIYMNNLVLLENAQLVTIFAGQILKDRPKIIGISMYGDSTLFQSLLIKELKERSPGSTIIAGGSFTPFMLMEQIHSLLNEGVDYIVMGDATSILNRLVEKLDHDNDREIREIPQLVYKNGNEIIKTTNDNWPIDSHLEIIPDFSLYDLDEFIAPIKILPLLSSTGCSWRKCTFCTHHKIFRKHYLLPISHVVETIKKYKQEYNVDYYTFHDEEVSSKRMVALSNAFISNGLAKDTFFYAYARFSKHFSEKSVAQAVYDGGFRLIFWGLESANKRILKLMDKGYNIDYVPKILKDFSDVGVSNILFVMFGFPTETIAEAQETVEFLRANRQHISGFLESSFTLDNGSIVDTNRDKFGVTKVLDNFNFEVSSGMSSTKSALFLRHLKQHISDGTIQLAKPSLQIINTLNINALRVSSFYIAALEPLTKKKALNVLESDSWTSVAPIICGKFLKDMPNRYVFCKINKSWSWNLCNSNKIEVLSDLESALIRLSSGNLTLFDIMQSVKIAESDHLLINKFLMKLVKHDSIYLFTRISNPD